VGGKGRFRTDVCDPPLDRVKREVVGLVHFADILPIIYRSLIVEKYEESGRPPRPGPSQTKPKSVNLRAPQSTQIRVDDLQTLECFCAVRPSTYLTINFDPMSLDHVCDRRRIHGRRESSHTIVRGNGLPILSHHTTDVSRWLVVGYDMPSNAPRFSVLQANWCDRGDLGRKMGYP